MAAVRAGNHAASAADALLPMKFREYDRVTLQHIGGIADGIQGKASRFLHAGKAFFSQIIVEPGFEIVDDAVAILHHRRRDLNASGAQQNEFQRVRPVLHAAHGAQMHALQRRVLPQLGNEAQRDWFDRIAAVAAHRGHAVYRGGGDIGMGIDPDDTLDRIDGGDPVRTAAFGRLGRGAHDRHIGCELGKDRELCTPSRCGGEALHQLRRLADIRAQAAVRHVGAGEVQLDGVRAVFLAETGELLPLRIILAHNGGQNEFGRIFHFQAAKDLHVFRHAVVGELLNVFEADDTAAISRDGGEAGRCLMNIKGTDGLEGRACPARLKGAGAHIIGAGHHGGGEQERVLQRHTAELRA